MRAARLPDPQRRSTGALVIRHVLMMLLFSSSSVAFDADAYKVLQQQ